MLLFLWSLDFRLTLSSAHLTSLQVGEWMRFVQCGNRAAQRGGVRRKVRELVLYLKKKLYRIFDKNKKKKKA